jgi:Secretion system C-terminal sorting domain
LKRGEKNLYPAENKLFFSPVNKKFMKTVLRSFLFIGVLLVSTKISRAQCTVSNIVIQNVRVISSTPTSCTAKADITFNIEDNNGNKYIFMHVWLQNDYPDYFQCVNGRSTRNGSIPAPVAADLGSSFNIGLDNDGTGIVAMTTYPPDASVPLAIMDSVSKVILPDGSANITMYGVLVTAPVPCGTPVVLVADVWSSQANNAQRAHCVSCGIRYSAGFLNLTGFVNCATLRYGGTLSNITGTVINGYYRVFADVNGDGYFTPFTDTLLLSNTNFTIAANGSILISGDVPRANINQNVFIVVTQTTGTATEASRVFLLRTTFCSILPVNFSSFSTTRTSRSNVLLKWETLTEANNTGFSVQRIMGNNRWETTSFVPSLGQNGSSTSILNYTYNDLNSNPGITQYRIQQEDFDGKTRLSEIRAVRGFAQKEKNIVYPNPSTDGRVNVAFENKEETRDIILTDMKGQVVKQWKGYTNNILKIENLVTGMYTIRITARQTGNQTVEKIMVSQY